MEVKFDPVLTDINAISTKDNSFLVYHYLIPSLKQAINEHAKGNLIDLGCGNRPYQHLLQGKINAYTGCDFVQNSKQSVDLICDVTRVPLPDESFDTCLSTQVLEHIPDPDALIREACRLLKPGGVLILSAPLYWPEHGEPYDYNRFTSFGLTERLSRLGFANIRIIANGGAWATAGQSFAHAFMYSSSRSFLFRLLRFLFYRLQLIRVSNRIISYMDKKDYNPVNTMNYVVTAQKSAVDR